MPSQAKMTGIKLGTRIAPAWQMEPLSFFASSDVGMLGVGGAGAAPEEAKGNDCRGKAVGAEYPWAPSLKPLLECPPFGNKAQSAISHQ
jgi:hypothetical protein